MMDVKNTKAVGGSSIITMLVRNAIAKNQEMKELIEKPSRDDESRKVREPDKSSHETTNTLTAKDDTPSNPNMGKLVNVNV